MSFDLSQFKGIHDVTTSPERVWVGNNWSIEVPVGYSYTVDPEHVGEGPSGKYLIHVQKSEDCDFSEPYSSDFNLLVYSRLELISCNSEDLMDKDLIASINDLPSHLLHNYLLHRCSGDLLVFYSIVEETEEISRYNFQVAVRGCNLVYTGQFSCYDGTIEERHKIIIHWLSTIDVLTEDERLSFAQYSGKSIIGIPTEFSSETAVIDKRIEISIPKGFHAETDPLIIGSHRRLVIVPSDYSTADDPMNAPIALSVQAGVAENLPSRIDLVDKYFTLFCNTGAAFKQGFSVNMYKHSDKAFTISQGWLISDAHAAKTITALFANDRLYTIHIVINYPAFGFDQPLADWDIDHFSKAWLARIQVDGEIIPDYPVRSGTALLEEQYTASDKQSIGVPADKRASYNRVSDLISVSNDDPSLFLVNGEWTFRLPDGFIYETDCDFDGGIQGGIDLSGETKPMVIKGIADGAAYLFNFALQKHYDAFGNYYSIIDCKYDNRVADDNSSALQKIITDEDDLYVDVMAVNTWPFGDDLKIRVRTPEGTPFDFFSMAKGLDDDGARRVSEAMKEIALSIALANAGSKASSTSAKAVESFKAQPNDPNCIIEGTILRKYIGSATAVVLPDGITEITDNTFSGRNIKSIVVPEGVTKIGSRVFENCFDLEEAVLPSTLEELGDYSFVDCHKLKSITLGDNMTAITDSLFSECYKLENVTIPQKAEYIDNFAFKNCRSFTRIVIPDSVQSIGFSAFASCEALEYLYIPASVTRIEDNFFGGTPFDDCPNLTIHCPSGSTAENYCRSHGLKYITDSQPKTESTSSIQKGNSPKVASTTIETAAAKQVSFPSSKNVPSIKWTKVKDKDCEIDILDSLTAYNGKAKSLILPDGIRTIGEDAFSCNDNITSVLVPEGVETIEKCAFGYCANLKNVYLPCSLTEIGDEAFRLCKSLTSIVIPDGCTHIGMDCFTFCDQLTDIYVPASVIFIENDAFFTTNEDTVIHTEPGSEAETFAEENDIRYDYKPAPDLSPIIDAAYAPPASSKPQKAIMTTAGDNPTAIGDNNGSVSKPADFIIDKNGNLTKYKGKAENVQIPSGVKKIAYDSFKGKKKIVSLSLPEGVTEIDAFVFEKCTKLVDVILPETLKTIGDNAFSECSALKNIDIPDQVRKIGKYAFYECRSLESVSLPSSLEKIGESAFSRCARLRDIVFPERVKKISKNCCLGCNNLASVRLPASLEMIDDSAFSLCNNLRQVTISEGVTELRIEKYAFLSCNSITFYLPESLSSIEPKDAFSGYFVDKLVVYKDSFAEKYAIENKVKYEAIPPEQKKEDDPQTELDIIFNALS